MEYFYCKKSGYQRYFLRNDKNAFIMYWVFFFFPYFKNRNKNQNQQVAIATINRQN